MSIPTPLRPLATTYSYAPVMTLAPFTCFRIPQIGPLDEFEMVLSIVRLDNNRAVFSRNGVECCMVYGFKQGNTYTNWIARRTSGDGARGGARYEHRYISTVDRLYAQLEGMTGTACEAVGTLEPREQLIGRTGEDFSMLTFGLSCKNSSTGFVWGAGTMQFSRLFIHSKGRIFDIRQDLHGEFRDTRSGYHFRKSDMREHFPMDAAHQ